MNNSFVKEYTFALNNIVSATDDAYTNFHNVSEYLVSKGVCPSRYADTLPPYLLSLGTDFVLDGGPHKLAMAANIVFSTTILLDEKSTSLTCVMRDLHENYERTIIRFLSKRIPCDCLRERYDDVTSRPKMGWCGACKRSVECKKLMVCGVCNTAQYCSRACQQIDWPRHKVICRELLYRRQCIDKTATG